MMEKQKAEQQAKMLRFKEKLPEPRQGQEYVKITLIFSQGPVLKMKKNM